MTLAHASYCATPWGYLFALAQTALIASIMPPGSDKRKRAKDRTRVTVNMPDPLYKELKQLANEQCGGDMNEIIHRSLAKAGFETAADFLRSNKNFIYKRKKLK